MTEFIANLEFTHFKKFVFSLQKVRLFGGMKSFSKMRSIPYYPPPFCNSEASILSCLFILFLCRALWLFHQYLSCTLHDKNTVIYHLVICFIIYWLRDQLVDTLLKFSSFFLFIFLQKENRSVTRRSVITIITLRKCTWYFFLGFSLSWEGLSYCGTHISQWNNKSDDNITSEHLCILKFFLMTKYYEQQ